MSLVLDASADTTEVYKPVLLRLDKAFGVTYCVVVNPEGVGRCTIELTTMAGVPLTEPVAAVLESTVQIARRVKTLTRRGNFDNEGSFQDVEVGDPPMAEVERIVTELIERRLS